MTQKNNPLFIPLRKEHFFKFKSREKTSEYRPYGPRWNEDTCPPGREVILSCGYGSHDRLTAIIDRAVINEPTPAFIEIYGTSRRCFDIALVDIQEA